MDKQRGNYRQLLLKLFEENFASALFVEKTDTMMKISDFETIRNEVEEDYYIKNCGITPYIAAIKYLCKKIELCTADNTLFTAIEDYICAKENIVVTKIAKEKTPTELVAMNGKKRKGGKKMTGKSETTATPVGHAECNSPNTCKKCRIMRRLDRPKSKPTKRAKKAVTQTPTKEKVEQVKIEMTPEVKSEEKIEVKTEVHDPDYPNYMESIETVINASKEPILKPNATQLKASNQNQLPYLDHQYSRINFYGSGDATETKAPETVVQPEKIRGIKARKRSNGITKATKKSQQQPQHEVIRPKPMIYRFNPISGQVQPATPAYFAPCIASTSSTVDQYTPAVIRSIHRPVPNIYANATVPVHFKTIQESMMQQPIYYLQFYKPQE